jgi:hypothetical protein
MWEQINGVDFCGVNKKHKEEILIWRLCFMVSYGRKNTFGQIQEKMVWSIHGIVLFTQ